MVEETISRNFAIDRGRHLSPWRAFCQPKYSPIHPLLRRLGVGPQGRKSIAHIDLIARAALARGGTRGASFPSSRFVALADASHFAGRTVGASTVTLVIAVRGAARPGKPIAATVTARVTRPDRQAAADGLRFVGGALGRRAEQVEAAAHRQQCKNAHQGERIGDRGGRTRHLSWLPPRRRADRRSRLQPCTCHSESRHAGSAHVRAPRLAGPCGCAAGSPLKTGGRRQRHQSGRAGRAEGGVAECVRVQAARRRPGVAPAAVWGAPRWGGGR